MWSTVLELAASNWQPPRAKGNKDQQETLYAASIGKFLSTQHPFHHCHVDLSLICVVLARLLSMLGRHRGTMVYPVICIVLQPDLIQVTAGQADSKV